MDVYRLFDCCFSEIPDPKAAILRFRSKLLLLLESLVPFPDAPAAKFPKDREAAKA